MTTNELRTLCAANDLTIEGENLIKRALLAALDVVDAADKVAVLNPVKSDLGALSGALFNFKRVT